MNPSPTIIMRRGGRGRRAVLGAFLVAALLALGALLQPDGAYAAADAKPKPKVSKSKAKAKYKKAKPKVKGHVKRRVLVVIGTPRSETDPGFPPDHERAATPPPGAPEQFVDARAVGFPTDEHGLHASPNPAPEQARRPPPLRRRVCRSRR